MKKPFSSLKSNSMALSFFKKIRNQLEDLAASFLVRVLVFIFRFIPFKTLGSIAGPIGSFGFHFVKRYRNRVIENLNIAFGEERGSEKASLLSKEIFPHLACTLLEFFYLLANAHREKQFLPQIKIRGKENLEDALAKGHGVVALGIHLGAFFLLPSRLAADGYLCNVVINPGRFLRLWETFEHYHRIFGVRTIYIRPMVTALKKCFHSLHQNEILYVLADEQQRRRGISTLFFDREAFTSPGPAALAIRTGAPILPMYVLRGNGLKRTLVIAPPVTIRRTGDEERDIELLTREFTRRIEQIVRQYPSQWSWLNRRWKLPHLQETGSAQGQPPSGQILIPSAEDAQQLEPFSTFVARPSRSDQDRTI